MGDLFLALFEVLIFIIQGVCEGTFSKSRSQLGCALGAAAVVSTFIASAALLVAFLFRQHPYANLLVGLACCGGAFALVAIGLAALFVAFQKGK